MKDIDRLKQELEKQKKELEQSKFFVGWLEDMIKLEEIKEVTNEN